MNISKYNPKTAAKAERFGQWFRTQGHWIYPSRAAAIDKWVRDGIVSLPDLTETERGFILQIFKENFSS